MSTNEIKATLPDERSIYIGGCNLTDRALSKIMKRISAPNLYAASGQGDLKLLIATVLYATGEAMRLDGVEFTTELWFAPDTWRPVARMARNG